MARTQSAVGRGSIHPVTPDGRYFVVRGRLWRMSDPSLDVDQRQVLVTALMAARRAVRDALRANDSDAENAARLKVDQFKIDLGERGPVWWTDGAPDQNRYLAKNSTYAEWFAALVAGPFDGSLGRRED